MTPLCGESSVITDHKHLHYLRNVKRLNPHQARWALFFTRLNFTSTNCPGDSNVKADSLSHIHSPDAPKEPEPILPPVIVVSSYSVGYHRPNLHSHSSRLVLKGLLVNIPLRVSRQPSRQNAYFTTSSKTSDFQRRLSRTGAQNHLTCLEGVF